MRAGNFDEVALGFTLELAQLEAERCLQCAKPHCVDGCPVGVQIPQFIKALRDGRYGRARSQAMKAKNNLPAICGRVCPQEVAVRVILPGRRKNGQPVAIGRLERFVGRLRAARAHLPAHPASQHRQESGRGRLWPVLV